MGERSLHLLSRHEVIDKYRELQAEVENLRVRLDESRAIREELETEVKRLRKDGGRHREEVLDYVDQLKDMAKAGDGLAEALETYAHKPNWILRRRSQGHRYEYGGGDAANPGSIARDALARYRRQGGEDG